MAVLAAAVLLVTSTASAQYPRTLLLEEFTNLTCKPCTTATPIINALLAAKAGRVVGVRYHPNMPLSGDPFYNANPAENKARADFYGVLGLPHGRANGSTPVVVTDETDVNGIADSLLQLTSPVKMEVTQTRAESQVTVKVVITAGPDGLTTGDIRLRVAIAEARIHDESYLGNPRFNGESDFYEVFRKMVPSTDGEEFKLTANEKRTFTYMYSIGSGWQADQMEAVAFVQNDDTKEVLQSAAAPAAAAGVETPADLSGFDLTAVRPNPTNDRVQLTYAIPSRERVAIDLHTMNGLLVRSLDQGTQEAGRHDVGIDLAGLPGGVYVCTLRAGARRSTRTITVIR